jgi:glucose/arabinose dehydrogenase
VAVLCSLFGGSVTAAERPRRLATALNRPYTVVAANSQIYVAVEGAVQVVRDGKGARFATGLKRPGALVAFQQWLYAADGDRIWRIDRTGKATVLAGPKAFPTPPRHLEGITADENGMLYACCFDLDKGRGGAIYRITPQGKVTRIHDGDTSTALKMPMDLLMDSQSHLLVLDFEKGLYRVAVAGGKLEHVAEIPSSTRGPSCNSLTRDHFGRLYLGSSTAGEVFAIPRPGAKPVLVARGLGAVGHIVLDPTDKQILVPDAKAGTLTAVPAVIPGWEVDETPLPIKTEVAFPDLKWTGWKGPESGKPVALRPLVLTHAGDGSNRVFVATQQGVLHVFPNDQKATKTKVFLDIEKKVFYNDNENEQGLLGLVFHPRYKSNGEFFVFYTDRKKKTENVVARFRVSKDDPDRADPTSEEELLRVTRPFWNHDGGTLCFGPDGYLYVALGDGGSANDPHDNAQNLKTLLGKVLRLDVDRKEGGKPYAIPRDNPFVKRKDARPEIWCYGLRNVWRMAFDRQTDKLWAADVGQNLWEEIDILTVGGNYGWNRREGLHPFGAKGTGPRKDMIEPIWEYHHDIGKSMTGGLVYRGQRLKELQGAYVYGDYVTAKIWALRYDEAKKRVVANRPIRDPNLPIMSFGEDEKGEIYFLTYSLTGKGIYRFVPSAPAKTRN